VHLNNKSVEDSRLTGWGQCEIMLSEFRPDMATLGPRQKIIPPLACLMARLLRYIHPHVSRYAQVDVPCRQTIIRRIRVELFLTVTLTPGRVLNMEKMNPVQPLFPHLPKRLEGLEELAENLWWSWNPGARMLFKTLDRQAWKESARIIHSVLRV